MKNRWFTLPSFIKLAAYCVFLVVFPLSRSLQAPFAWCSKAYFEALRHFGINPSYFRNIILITAVIAGIIFAWCFRSRMTKPRIIASAVCLFSIAASFYINDYYLGNVLLLERTYWHIFAYFFLSFFLYGFLLDIKIKDPSVISLAYLFTIVFASLNEIITLPIKNSVFDLNDVAKSGLGILIGMIFIYFVVKSGYPFRDNRKNFSIWHEKAKDYFAYPISLLILLWIFNFIFMFFSSLLSSLRYVPSLIFGTAGVSFVILSFYILSGRRFFRRLLILGFLVLALLQGIAYYKYRKDYVTYNRYALTVYKGVPIPFFDFLIFPDGSIRLVDKKHSFCLRDAKTLLRQDPEIVIFGTGSRGFGGKGKGISALKKNDKIRLIIEKTPDAVRIFNQLKKDEKDKRIIFVVHNTC